MEFPSRLTWLLKGPEFRLLKMAEFRFGLESILIIISCGLRDVEKREDRLQVTHTTN